MTQGSLSHTSELIGKAASTASASPTRIPSAGTETLTSLLELNTGRPGIQPASTTGTLRSTTHLKSSALASRVASLLPLLSLLTEEIARILGCCGHT
jgi:hypothetical protein